MKIVHLCDYIQPQLGYQEYYLAKEHAKMGHEVIVITSDRYYPFPNYKDTVEKILGPRVMGPGIEIIDGFKIIRLKTIFELGIKTWVLGLKKAIEKFNPDLVVCHGMDTFNAQRIAKLKNNFLFKLIFDDHPYTPFRKISFFKSIYYFFINFKLIEQQADNLIIISEDGLKHIYKYYKFKKPILVGGLGVDSKLFKYNVSERNKLRKRYDISQNEIILIYTGKILKNKGVHLILEAMVKINAKLILLIVGDGDKNYINELKLFSKINNIKIKFVKAVENKYLCNYFSTADIAIWPTEATISIIEAMSCSLPIICNNCVGEHIKYNNGFAISENVDEIVEKITLLIKNSELRKKMGLNSRVYVEKELSWKKIAEKFLK